MRERGKEILGLWMCLWPSWERVEKVYEGTSRMKNSMIEKRENQLCYIKRVESVTMRKRERKG
jgi:hypothetical protein